MSIPAAAASAFEHLCWEAVLQTVVGALTLKCALISKSSAAGARFGVEIVAHLGSRLWVSVLVVRVAAVVADGGNAVVAQVVPCEEAEFSNPNEWRVRVGPVVSSAVASGVAMKVAMKASR